MKVRELRNILTRAASMREDNGESEKSTALRKLSKAIALADDKTVTAMIKQLKKRSVRTSC